MNQGQSRSWNSMEPIDIPRLARDLKRTIRGEVRFDPGTLALYSTDASNYRQIPIGVVIPIDVEDVRKAVEICRLFGAPILPRGGGVSLAGQSCNVAVVIDFSKYIHRILELDPEKRVARVQPGVVLDDLRDEAERYHLTFAPDPATHTHCTLGGMIGNNSCGAHSVMGGKTDDNILELDVLTYDGLRMKVGTTTPEELDRMSREGGGEGCREDRTKEKIYSGLKSLADRYSDSIRMRYPKIPRRVSGYNLPPLLPGNGFNVAQALVGSEGTCVLILEALVRLVHSPPGRSLVVLGYPDVYRAADQIEEILALEPIALEGFDEKLTRDVAKKGEHTENLKLLPEGKGWLLVEFGGDTKEASHEAARRLIRSLAKGKHSPAFKIHDDPVEEKKVWKIRESGLGATARVPGQKDTWPGWEDAGIPPEKLSEYLRDFRSLVERYDYDCALYGHFGQGCVHTRIDFDLTTREGIRRFRSFIFDAADLVVQYGGSFSGEHGDGQSRAELLPRMFGEDLVQAFREFKSLWDPEWKMNPGKIVDPYRIDENLRLGTGYRPSSLQTHFHFTADKASFPYAIQRCVGIGECRKEKHGTMCPSFMGTREEMHSTRGRSRLIFEMLRGDVVSGWKDKHVKEALDLCLSCKSCKGECPMNVDMATYKAEFLSHYYKGKVREIDAYSIGLIYWWSRAASRMPGLTNVLLQTRPISTVIKQMAGISTRRQFPLYAGQNFRAWFRRRAPKNIGKPKVLLWPDTFNNSFFPETAQAAVEVLEACGFQVTIPSRPLCCGRPLFDYGMLDLAKYLLRQVLTVLRPSISDGVPVVGLEPACLVTFRDELVDLFPNDEDARRLKEQSFLLSEFLEKKAPRFELPKMNRKAIVHGHCNHKAVMKMEDEEKVLRRLGLDFEMLDSGCCGVSGAFGFRRKNYDLSLKIGERVLLPAVRKADKDTLIIANGFSCREQIFQTTDRQGLHLSQVISMAMRESGQPLPAYPERGYYFYNRKDEQGKLDYHPFTKGLNQTVRRHWGWILLSTGAVIGAGLVLWSLKKRRRSR